MEMKNKKLYVREASPNDGKDIDWSKARRVVFPNLKRTANLGSAGVPPVKFGVAPNSLSDNLRQSNKRPARRRTQHARRMHSQNKFLK